MLVTLIIVCISFHLKKYYLFTLLFHSILCFHTLITIPRSLFYLSISYLNLICRVWKEKKIYLPVFWYSSTVPIALYTYIASSFQILHCETLRTPWSEVEKNWWYSNIKQLDKVCPISRVDFFISAKTLQDYWMFACLLLCSQCVVLYYNNLLYSMLRCQISLLYTRACCWCFTIFILFMVLIPARL